jgi:hypothetical protein
VEVDPVHDHPAAHGRAVRRPPLRRRQAEHVGRPAKGLAARQWPEAPALPHPACRATSAMITCRASAGTRSRSRTARRTNSMTCSAYPFSGGASIRGERGSATQVFGHAKVGQDDAASRLC